jgi:signal transduction histidine kinase
MSPDVRKKIFLPFYTTKDVQEGTGLGLSVVHGIIKSHGGKIEVESQENVGSCFTVTLPTLAKKAR